MPATSWRVALSLRLYPPSECCFIIYHLLDRDSAYGRKPDGVANIDILAKYINIEVKPMAIRDFLK
jgi:hypothetical protein